MAEHNLPITPRIIVCGMRQLHPTETEKLAEIAWRYRDKGVVAFDLAGPESGHASKNHKVHLTSPLHPFPTTTLSPNTLLCIL